eukprot:55635-Lingulodinium_polyedra.AAC.1
MVCPRCQPSQTVPAFPTTASSRKGAPRVRPAPGRCAARVGGAGAPAGPEPQAPAQARKIFCGA